MEEGSIRQSVDDALKMSWLAFSYMGLKSLESLKIFREWVEISKLCWPRAAAV